MTDALLAALISFSVVIYWAVCRNRAFEQQQKVVALIEQCFANQAIKSTDVTFVYFCYKLARHYLFFPILALLSPFAVLAILLNGKLIMSGTICNLEMNREIHDLLNEILKLYLIKNPLTCYFSMMIIWAMMTVGVTAGVFLHRVTTFLNPFNPMGLMLIILHKVSTNACKHQAV